MTHQLDVRLVDLPAMTVARALGYGKEPESLAFQALRAFASKQGVEPASPGHELYGFNNPDPSPDRDEYGYELWMRVEPGTSADPPIEVLEIPASSYAVTRLTGLSNIGRVWKELGAWHQTQGSVRGEGCHGLRWLESLQNPAEPDVERWIFDLYLETRSS